MDDENIPTGDTVDIGVSYMLDAAGQEWVKLTFTSPDSPQQFSLAYSREKTQRLIELLQGVVDQIDADVD